MKKNKGLSAFYELSESVQKYYKETGVSIYDEYMKMREEEKREEECIK